MKVVLPSVAAQNHTINLIPRIYPTGAISFYLKKKETKVETLIANTYTTTNGNLALTFNYQFTERDKYTIRILSGTTVIYRGQLMATVQTTQSFQPITDYITY